MKGNRFKCTRDNLIWYAQDISSELDKIDNEQVRYLSDELSKSISGGDKFNIISSLNISKRPLAHIWGEEDDRYQELTNVINVCNGVE